MVRTFRTRDDFTMTDVGCWTPTISKCYFTNNGGYAVHVVNETDKEKLIRFAAAFSMFYGSMRESRIHGRKKKGKTQRQHKTIHDNLLI